jgi:hypothetical protein
MFGHCSAKVLHPFKDRRVAVGVVSCGVRLFAPRDVANHHAGVLFPVRVGEDRRSGFIREFRLSLRTNVSSLWNRPVRTRSSKAGVRCGSKPSITPAAADMDHLLLS